MKNPEGNPITYGHRALPFEDQRTEKDVLYVARSDRMEFVTENRMMTLYNRDIVQEGLLDPRPVTEHLTLTPARTDVLRQIASGKSNQEIAEYRGIKEQTVKGHVSDIMIDLDAKNRTHAVVQAIRKGVLNITDF